MRALIRYTVAILFFLIVSAPVMGGGPWPQKKGHGYYKLFQYWVIADKHYTDTGETDPNVTTGYFSTSLYAEYGISGRLTGVVYFPFFARTYYNNTISATTGEEIIPGDDLNSVGDIDLSLTYGLLVNKPIAMSATLLLGIPSGKTDGGELETLQTGDGEFNQMIRLDVGKGFTVNKVNMYTSAYAGFNNRTNGYSDEFRYGFEAGATFCNSKLTGIARFIGIASFQNGTATAASDGASLFSNNVEYLTFSPELAYHFNENWGVSVNYNTVFFGKLIMANPAYSVGIFLQI
ncbi:hypothetical protein V6R21_29540 [Limibacter armeniacum]|uniref:hypothetical protein n=1 Tax=Limibacter armeniacum TaxID=466084 RepID=UPI002FE528D8